MPSAVAPGLEANFWIIPALPLLAALVTAALGPRWLKSRSHWPCIVALGFAAFLSVVSLFEVGALKSDGAVVSTGYEWVNIGGLTVNVVLRGDALTAVMLVTVTFISLLVAIYSTGYMYVDPGYPRFFAVVSLFVFCMTMLVLASNFLLLYVFWEGVGLCSYLLIGFWFKPSAAAAARKAFLVNRIGDFGFLLGIFLIWTTFDSLDFDTVFSKAAQDPAGVVTVICLLLFMGAAGKSAQFPLHVWLPDAMEGPTPVSALIHAATMVTAGVYLVARATPLFVLAPGAQALVAVVGALTALMAAIIALTQNDLKRVMAYSTVSQLGLMFLALGCAAGKPALAAFAVAAAIFHLFTHAFFKALLFLASGSVMHAMGDVIDMRRFGGLRRVIPWTHWTFAVGAAALAGVPPLAGFWSKEEILVGVAQAGDHAPYAGLFALLLIVALFTAFLTAFYTARAYFLTFWGEERFPPEAGDHPHEAPWSMLGPLLVLAAGALTVGWLFGPTGWFAHLGANPVPPARRRGTPRQRYDCSAEHFPALAGVAVAGVFYVWKPGLPRPAAERAPVTYDVSLHKFYLDELYVAFIVRPGQALASLCRWVDSTIVDGLVDFTGHLPVLAGRLLQPVQNGLVQFYALAMLLGLAVFLAAMVARIQW